MSWTTLGNVFDKALVLLVCLAFVCFTLAQAQQRDFTFVTKGHSYLSYQQCINGRYEDSIHLSYKIAKFNETLSYESIQADSTVVKASGEFKVIVENKTLIQEKTLVLKKSHGQESNEVVYLANLIPKRNTVGSLNGHPTLSVKVTFFKDGKMYVDNLYSVHAEDYHGCVYIKCNIEEIIVSAQPVADEYGNL